MYLQKVVKKGRTKEEVDRVICGVRVENIEEPLIQKIRWLDKLVDELAKGKPMEKGLEG